MSVMHVHLVYLHVLLSSVYLQLALQHAPLLTCNSSHTRNLSCAAAATQPTTISNEQQDCT